MLAALADLGGLDLPEAGRPGLAQRAENDYVGVPCGIMDQTAAIRCQAGHALFLDCRSRRTGQIPFDPAAAGLRLLVIDTRAPTGWSAVSTPHGGPPVNGPRRRWASPRCAICHRTSSTPRCRAGRRSPAPSTPCRHRERAGARHRGARCARVRSITIGPLLTASHASLRDDYQVTVPELDTAADGGAGGRRAGRPDDRRRLRRLRHRPGWAAAVDAVTQRSPRRSPPEVSPPPRGFPRPRRPARNASAISTRSASLPLPATRVST